MRVLTVGVRFSEEGEGPWPALVAALRARGDEVDILTTDGPGPGHEAVQRELRWFWDEDRQAWRRPPRLEASRIARHDLRVLGDTVRAGRPDVVVWASMGGLPLTLVGASGLPELALVVDDWPASGPRVDPVTKRDGWDPGAVAVWCCATDALAATVAALDGVAAERITVDADAAGVLRRLDALVDVETAG